MGVLRPAAAALLAALAAAPPPAAAAPVAWTGGAAGDWHAGANWSGGLVPGPADDVTVDADAFVAAYATNPAVAAASLVLGAASGAFAPVLRLSSGAAISGALTLHLRSALQLDTTAAISVGQAFLRAGSSVAALSPPSAAGGGAARLYAAGSFELQAGATVAALGRGYAGGALSAAGEGPGAGGAGSASSGGGGGGHGGSGGFGGSGSNAGAAHGAYDEPDEGGSGGGGTTSSPGGAGGGVIEIRAASLALDGLLIADGEPGGSFGAEGGGGGAGGTIRLRAGALSGTGTLSARGGVGGTGVNFGGGAGGGGRITVRVTGSYAALGSTLAYRATGGNFGGGASFGTSGAAGSVFVDPRHWTAVAGGGAASTAGNWVGGIPLGGERLVFGSSDTGKTCAWDLAGVAVGSVTAWASFSTSVVLQAALSVSGGFDWAGGTISAAAGLALTAGGPVSQSGGRWDLLGATLALRGVGGAAGASFADARAGLLQAGGAGGSTITLTGLLDLRGRGELSSGAHLVLSTTPAGLGILRVGGDGPFVGAGTLQASPLHQTVADGASAQSWSGPRGPLGALRVSNSAGRLVLVGGAGASYHFLGGVSVDTGTVLDASTASLRVGGGWEAYGAAGLSRSTVAFAPSAGSTAVVSAGALFDSLRFDGAPGSVVRVTTFAVAAASVTVLGGTVSLEGSTVQVRGSWIEQAGALVLGSSCAAVFDGSGPQVLHQRPGSSFGVIRSSSAAGLALGGAVRARGDFLWDRGTLSLAGAALTVGGDLLPRGGGGLSVAASTVTLDGAAAQTVSLPTLDSVVVANTSAQGARMGVNMTVGNFSILPGAVFDGLSRALTVTGSSWASAGATYLSAAQQHSVSWNPSAGGISVASGSVVNAKLALFPGKTAWLEGGLEIRGAGNSFTPHSGAAIVNAPSGSTIAFRDSSDLVPGSGPNWFYAGAVADSWLVFEGTGLARGAALSTTTFGGLRVELASSTEVFRAPTLNLLGDLVLARGSVQPTGGTISLGGDLLQSTAATLSFLSASTGTLRLQGGGTQTLSLAASSHTLWNLVHDSTGAASLFGDLSARGAFIVSRGTFSAGANQLSVAGRVLVSTAARFDALSSTLTLAGASAGQTHQAVEVYGSGAFHGLQVAVSSASFLTSAAAGVLTASLAGSTLAFAPGTTLRADDLRVGGASGAALRLRSTVPGSAWSLSVVSVSSVTQALVSDSDASSGRRVYADDGRAFDGGGNSNWDFTPTLLVILPGESFTPAAAPGKAGSPASAPAGSTVAVTVLAVSSRYDPAAVSGTASLSSDDAYAWAEGPLSLVSGSTTFLFSPRTAEPSPRATVLTASASFAAAVSTLPVTPGSLARLQLLLPGQTSLPGSPSGYSGAAAARVRDAAFSATVRATDAFFNLVSSAADTAALGTSASTATLPGAAALSGGARIFSGLAIHATGVFTIVATDISFAGVLSATSPAFGVAPPGFSTPTVVLHAANGSVVATLGGSLTGSAADTVAVEKVTVLAFEPATGRYFDWGALSFSALSPVYATATLVAPLTPQTTWSLALPDAALTEGRRYLAMALADNPSGFRGVASSTFVFDRSSLVFGAKDGQGEASVSPSSAAGCAPLSAAVSFVAGPAGVGPGGAVAVRSPEGWAPALSTAAALPAPPGTWHAASTSAAMAYARLLPAPAARGRVPLGPGWALLELSTASPASFLPGQAVVFTLTAFPPARPGARGAYSFPVLAQGDGSGGLVALSSFPALSLGAGTVAVLAFEDPSPLALAPAQDSPSLRLTLTDRCGDSLPGASSGTVALSMSYAGGAPADGAATFRASGGGALSSVALSTGHAFSSAFIARTTAPAGSYLELSASGLLGTGRVQASRAVLVRSTATAFSDVSVSTAWAASGSTSAALSASDPAGSLARFSFRLADPAASWELVLSPDAVSFSSPVFRASGRGDAALALSAAWDGVDRFLDPPRRAAAGTYKARLSAGGGSAEDRTLEVVVPEGAGLWGQLGARGAGARIRAAGPGAGEGALAVASATGYFLLRGVRPGQAYRVEVSTVHAAAGRPVALSTAALSPAAASPAAAMGTLSLPATGELRVALLLPTPAGREASGGFTARGSDGAVAAFGSLRLSSGAASSDDGGTLFGRAASTWSAAVLAEGTYSVEAEVPALRVSTAATGVVVPAGGTVELRLTPSKRANIHGFALLESTAPFGTAVSIEARPAAGGAAGPSAAVFISSVPAAAGLSSAPYSLYGLDPGSWTVTARASGFSLSSAAVHLSGDADLGARGTAGGLDLRLSPGAGIAVSVAVSGDTRGLSRCFPAPGGGPGECPAGTFELEVEASSLAGLATARARARLASSASLSTGAVALYGLSAGTYAVRAALPGFVLSPSSGVEAIVASSGLAAAALSLAPADARLRLLVRAPAAPGACLSTAAYSSLGLLAEPARGSARAWADLAALAPLETAPGVRVSTETGAFAQIHCSSAAVFLPALPPGPARLSAAWGAGGPRAFASAALLEATTAAASLDLSAASAPVAGRLLLRGELSLSTRPASGAPFIVRASSPAAALLWGAPSRVCLLGARDPVELAPLRAFLIPLPWGEARPAPEAAAPGGAASCALPALSTAAPPSLAALAASAAADGSFAFPAVSTGVWLLRVPGAVDGEPGEEAAAYEWELRVGTAGASAEAFLGRGAKVSGRLVLPGGTRLTRRLRVKLAGPGGAALSADADFSGASQAPFAIPGVPDGRWRLSVADLGRPAAWAAPSRDLEVAGGDLSGLEAALEPAGGLTLRLAVARTNADGSEERVLLTRESAELLPRGFSVRARASGPGGGLYPAREPEGGEGAAVGPEGDLFVDGLPGGLYDLELAPPSGEGAFDLGALPLAGARVSGLSVAPGRYTDAGLVVLRAASAVSGRLTDAETGLPAAGVTVTARPSLASARRGAVLPQAVSGGDGRYRVEGLDPGVRWYDLTAAPRGGEAPGETPPPYEAKRRLAVDASTGAAADFALAPARCAIAGRVDAAGARIEVVKSGGGDDDPGAGLSVLAGGDGSFLIPSLAPGTYRLLARVEGYAPAARSVVVSSGTADAGLLRLSGAAAVFGALRRPDGSAPAAEEAASVAAVSDDLSERVAGTILSDPESGAAVSYRVEGLRAGRTYRLLLQTSSEEANFPEGGTVSPASTSEVRALDLVVRPPSPGFSARARKSGTGLAIDFTFTRPLRARTAADLDASRAVSTFSAAGSLSGAALSADRRVLSVRYEPGPGESRFVLRARAAVQEKDPDAQDASFPELIVDATAEFHAGVDAAHRQSVPNALGGTLTTEEGGLRVEIPAGAFAVPASSAVSVALRRSSSNSRASALPRALAEARAALPSSIVPASPFLDVELPAGVPSRLSKPARLTIPYEAGADPASLALYWYNPGSGEYILQPDTAGGASADAAGRTVTTRVDHFSTFVLLPAGAAAIGGSAHAQGELKAYAFPNPFDLNPKTVTAVHGLGAASVRGTMLRVAVPPGGGGRGRVRIFDAAGRLVRDLDLGDLAGGVNYYKDWDGRTASGRDAASGVYVGVAEVGARRKSFKLAVLK